MDAAALPGGPENAGNCGFQTLVSVGYYQLDADQAAALEALEEVRPEHLGFRGADVQADDLALAVGVDGDGDYCGDRDDPSALTLR